MLKDRFENPNENQNGIEIEEPEEFNYDFDQENSIQLSSDIAIEDSSLTGK